MENPNPLLILIPVALAWALVGLAFRDIRKGWLAGVMTLVGFVPLVHWLLPSTYTSIPYRTFTSGVVTSLVFLYFMWRDKNFFPGEKWNWIISSFVGFFGTTMGILLYLMIELPLPAF